MSHHLFSAKSFPEPKDNTLSIGTFGTNFKQILIQIPSCSSNKMLMEILSAKWQPFCSDLNLLMHKSVWIWLDPHHIPSITDYISTTGDQSGNSVLDTSISLAILYHIIMPYYTTILTRSSKYYSYMNPGSFMQWGNNFATSIKHVWYSNWPFW